MTTVHEAAAAQPAAGRTEPVGRAELVADAAARWTEELRALGGRDPLLYFRDLKVGTLDLAAADPETRKKLLDGEPVTVSRLFPHEPLRTSALRSARAIRDKARELAEERGIDAAMLAIGIATWANPFAAHRPMAPVLVRSATVAARDPAETDFVIEVSTDADINPVLLRALDTQLGLRFGLDSLRDRAGQLRYPQVVERLREFAPAHVVDGFSISHRAVLGTFAIEPNAAASDVEALVPELERHDIVAAVAGDEEAARVIREATLEAATGHQPHLVLDADVAQADLVAAVAAGRNVRVDAPPGTGRTQTIANLVGDLVASGQQVLVVGSKRASLTSVLDRLAGAGLDEVALDLSSVRSAAEAVGTVIDAAQQLSASGGDDTAGESKPKPARPAPRTDDDALRRYLDALHVSRDPWDCSAHELMAAVAATNPEARTSARVPSDALARYGVGTREALRVKLRAYAELGGLSATAESTPWSGATVPTVESAERIRAVLHELRSSALPDLRNAATRACVEVGLRAPDSPSDAFAAVDLLTSVGRTLDEFHPDIWSAPLHDFLAATADRKQRAAHDRRMTLLNRRRIRLQVRDLQVDPSARRARSEMHARLAGVREQLADWRERARDSRLPRTGPHLPAAVAAAAAAHAALEALAEAHPDLADLAELTFADLASRLADLSEADDVLMALPRLAELRADLDEAGLGDLLAKLTRRGADPDHAEAAFTHCWQSSVLEHVVAADPALAGFDREKLERRLAAQRESDLTRLTTASATVLAGRASRFAQVADEHEGQAAVVLESAHTGTGPRSLRELVAAAPDITLAAKPCWVMPPLAVSALLPTQRLFDVVIIEAAGQLSAAEAVPAIARARQIVLFGDQEQLVLPAFTTAVEPIADADDHQGPYEPFADGTQHAASIYEALTAAVARLPLLTEYRIRDDGLAAFASHNCYGDRLAVIPSADVPKLRHELVTADDEAGVDSSEAEVRRVVDMIFEHARTRPHESLGVITLSRPHAARIDAAVRAALIRAPDVAPFLREDREEPFFIKDVDRVCGDVRDAIILTLGYGRSVDGRVLYRFGALDRPGGDRRLAAAVTRSRERMTVLSSFGSDDLSPRRLTTDGGRALKDFLAVAENPAPMPSSNQGDLLAQAVADRLRAAGASVVVGYGSGPGQIEVAVRHPLRRDRFVLAVETDGPTIDARQHGRTRADLLIRRGWSVHRVWSAAWAADPDGENARLVDAYARAVADADAYDWAVAAAEADVVAGMPEDRRASNGERETKSTAAAGKPGRASKRKGKGSRGREAGSDDAPSDQDATEQANCGPKPVLVRRRSIGEHTGRELAALARWVDVGRPSRSEAEVAAELAAELEVLHQGPRADDVLIHAVRVARAGAPQLS